MKFVRISYFHSFEKQQLEDYLNDMSQKGYHLKSITASFFKFDYDENQQFHYYVDLQINRKSSIHHFPTEEYLEMFANEGYHFLGNYSNFLIFMSKNKEKSYSDDDNHISFKDIYRSELFSSVLQIIYNLLYVFVIVKSKILTGISISFLSDQTEIGILVCIIPLFLAEIISNSIPILRYRKNKQVHYTYKHILIRGCIEDILLALFFLLAGSFITHQSIELMSMFCICSLIVMIVGCILINKQSHHFISYYLSLILLILGLSISTIHYCTYDRPAKKYIQHEQIVEMNHESHSLLMGYVVYELKNSDDYLYTFEVYYPFLDDLVIRLLSEDEDYHKEGDIYISKQYVLIQKDDKFIKMPKQFYENHYNGIKW